jgi:hypothetical protein
MGKGGHPIRGYDADAHSAVPTRPDTREFVNMARQAENAAATPQEKPGQSTVPPNVANMFAYRTG